MKDIDIHRGSNGCPYPEAGFLGCPARSQVIPCIGEFILKLLGVIEYAISHRTNAKTGFGDHIGASHDHIILKGNHEFASTPDLGHMPYRNLQAVLKHFEGLLMQGSRCRSLKLYIYLPEILKHGGLKARCEAQILFGIHDVYGILNDIYISYSRSCFLPNMEITIHMEIPFMPASAPDNNPGLIALKG